MLAVLVLSIVSVHGPFDGAAAHRPRSAPALEAAPTDAAVGRERIVAAPRTGQGRVVLVADS